MNTEYSPAVSRLVTFGDARNMDEWPNYLELGLEAEHIPELIGIATNTELYWTEAESLEVWAPIHAWRALGQLRATAAIEPLMPLLHELDDSDWAGEELPKVYGLIGRDAIPALTRYLGDATHGLWPRITAAFSVERIAAHDPSARSECIAVLSQQLERFLAVDPELNAFVITYLVDLKAVEAAPLIERAFAAHRVDLSIQGDWEDVQIALGLKAVRETPRPQLHFFSPPIIPLLSTSKAKSSAEKAAAKAKSKRKQAKASRKKNKQRK